MQELLAVYQGFADEADDCFECFSYTAVCGRSHEIPGRGEDNLADNVGREIIA